MPQGVIKKLVDRGFGFIKGVKGEIFFHQSALEGTTFEALSEGQQVAKAPRPVSDFSRPTSGRAGEKPLRPRRPAQR